VVYDQDGVKIIAFKVNHFPVVPAVGYRFDYKGRSLVVSGDTVYSESLMEHAKGADVLFHEALNTKMVQLMNEYAGETGSPSLGKVTHDIPATTRLRKTPPKSRPVRESGNWCIITSFHHCLPHLKNLFMGDAKKYFKGRSRWAKMYVVFSAAACNYDQRQKRFKIIYSRKGTLVP